MMKRILKITIPGLLMVLLIYLMRGGKDIIAGLFIFFPIIYIVMGIIYSNFWKELVIGVFLTSIAFLVPINLCFHMGTCIDMALTYIVLSCVTYFIKKCIKRRKNNMSKEERFVRIYTQGKFTSTEIWVDKETGVNYLFRQSGYAGGMTPLLDKDGKPIITPLNKE